jgi:PmbA protein
VDYRDLAKKLVHRAKKKGAREAEAFLEIGRQSSCRVREGEIEDLTEATSKGVGLRVISNQRLGFAYTSNFDPDTLNQFVDRALQLAQAAAPNKLNGLPSPKDLTPRSEAGDLFDPEIARACRATGRSRRRWPSSGREKRSIRGSPPSIA